MYTDQELYALKVCGGLNIDKFGRNGLCRQMAVATRKRTQTNFDVCGLCGNVVDFGRNAFEVPLRHREGS